MIELIVMLNLTAAANLRTNQTAQYSTCQWPSRCVQQEAVLAQYTTCQWPSRCRTTNGTLSL